VQITIDNAPWHRGEPIRAAPRDHPNLELYRLPLGNDQVLLRHDLPKEIKIRVAF